MINTHCIKGQSAVENKAVNKSSEEPFVFEGTFLKKDFGQGINESFSQIIKSSIRKSGTDNSVTVKDRQRKSENGQENY